ncbi:hypothetical protein BGZ76_006125 [Entomortierella beljakovae]|nr:hypothetical protein BGZ76_006125 [Entomortierella beljakovae]
MHQQPASEQQDHPQEKLSVRIPMERLASSGSLKRLTNFHSTSSTGLASPVGSLSSSSLSFPEELFSNNPDDYDIKLPIGYGSSAVVYNAYYKPLNKRIAIKVIDLDMFERNQIDELRRETQVMALCKHPNLLRVNGAFVTDSKLYIVTPYLSAGSCLDIMKTAFPDGLDEISIATILKQALQGLDYLHKNGHIHRQVDVKAGNLLMDDDGSVLLADFGVSSSLMESGERRGMRKTFVGTPCWMAPEVMEQAGYDYKADIWSFGITALELATGHAPFAKYPPIKVLMLTLSNDPPTLDRDSTKHKYSKLFKEMIDMCLQKDPTKRPSTEKLLNHQFFKQAKKKSYLVSALLHDLPPLEQRPPKKAEKKEIAQEKGVSWDFDGDDHVSASSSSNKLNEDTSYRPRTVTFESTPTTTTTTTTTTATTTSRPSSIATTGSSISTGATTTHTNESTITDVLSEDTVSSQCSTQPLVHTGDKPVKKSRFVIEESPSVTPLSTPHPIDTLQPSSVQPISQTQKPSAIQTANLQGLGVIQGTADQSVLSEVKKGRFSVKDTSLGVVSPAPISIKAISNEQMPSPSCSLSSSPIDAANEGVRISTPLESALPSERKSRFEVHHSHGTATPGGVVPTNGTVLSPMTQLSIHGTPISRESSQSRITGESGLTRDNSVTRASRFSVESNIHHSENSIAPVGTSTHSPGAHSTANIPSATQSKRSRFQVSSVDSSRTGGDHESPSSIHSTPTTSPTGSVLRGQPGLLEALGSSSIYSHLDALYRQNEQQRNIIAELFTGLGVGSGTKAQNEVAASHHVNNSGSIHRQEQGAGQSTTERQLQIAMRENESLKRENEALKRELDRLRRGSL